MAEVHGEVAPGFEPVADAFAANFDRHGEVGAAFALYHHGQLVVDLWGGVADTQSGRAWEHDTLQLVYSTTKAATAVCALLLAQRGDLHLDAPVVAYWPEFKERGKDEVPVRWLLCHKSGLPATRARLPQADVLAWQPIVDALAAEEPWWEPGTAHGYHALTYGWLVGEVVRRVSGRTLGAFFREEVAEPLALDFWIGLPEELEPRVSRLEQLGPGLRPRDELDVERLPEGVREMVRQILGPDSITMRALNLCEPPFDYNDRAVHAAEIPAAGGITTARSLARMYAALIGEVDGVRILSDETVHEATLTHAQGPDRVLWVPTRFGLGFMLSSRFSPLLGPRSFGHAGAGGSLGFADPEAGVAYGYVMNKMQANLAGDPRTVALIDAVRTCVARG